MQKQLGKIIQKLYSQSVEPELSRPKSEFGDYATNVALILAGKLGKKPHDIAEEIVAELKSQVGLAEVTVAGPGFINLRLSDETLVKAWQIEPMQIYTDKTIIAEYSDPNPFKVLHAGHFYTSVVGDVIANLIEAAGGRVYRTNFGGDVGLHVGKTLYGIVQDLGGELPEKMAEVAEGERAEWLGKCYVVGTRAYEDDEKAKAQITEYNKAVYQMHADNDHVSPLAQIYWLGREWSYDYFQAFYDRIGSHFDKFYPESATAERGLKEVKAQIGKVFEESDGAIVFRGEKFGLHTRVFINREGLPTYETKDVGLSFMKYDDYKFDKSIIITGNEQKQYMEVVLKAIEQFAPELALNTTHLTHGLVKLAGGVKMSSRKGNFLRAVDILDLAIKANEEQNDSSDERVALGAIKYSFLRPRIGGDIIYDPKEAVSLVGNSGVYLQYAGARACSVLRKTNYTSGDIKLDFDTLERPLAVKLGKYHEVVNQAVQELLPHLVCNYLYELTQTFSHFYEHAPVIGHEREAIRLRLVAEFRDKLFAGLKLIDIIPLEEM
ncbi:MAG: arginine--tRNA ligase [Candidatus Nanosyncoccaceae bacterium]